MTFLILTYCFPWVQLGTWFVHFVLPLSWLTPYIHSVKDSYLHDNKFIILNFIIIYITNNSLLWFGVSTDDFSGFSLWRFASPVSPYFSSLILFHFLLDLFSPFLCFVIIWPFLFTTHRWYTTGVISFIWGFETTGCF